MSYKSNLRQLKARRKSKNERFNLFDFEADHNPYAIGLIPHSCEWAFELPNRKNAENLLIYGTNSWGQYLMLSLKWRPKNDNQVLASVMLEFRDDDQIVYQLNEEELVRIPKDQTIKEYRIAGISVEVLSPFRKFRIKVRALLRRKDTNELIFAKFRLFWTSISNIFDFENDFCDTFMAKELSSSTNSSDNCIECEDRYEQFGQIRGDLQFENLSHKELYLWGSKAKQCLTQPNCQLKSTRIYGYSKKGYAFHVGSAQLNTTNYRYGYAYFGLGQVFPITNITLTINEINKIEELLRSTNDVNTQIKFNIAIETEKRNFEVIIDKRHESQNVFICDMTLNECEGKAVIIIDDNSNEVFNLINESKPNNEIIPNLVFKIDDQYSDDVVYSGGKGASLASLSELSKKDGLKYCVPRGVIVTTNSYDLLLKQNQILKDEIDSLERKTCIQVSDKLKDDCERVSQMVASHDLPLKIKNEIIAQLTTIFSLDFETKSFAVRSSAFGEDSEEMSAAGQMTTFLGVKGIDEISRAIMKCWSSQFSFVAVEYKRGYGQEINSPMAVVIQEMVNCDSAGVIFTCDPLTGDERKLIITGNYGIGESVVSAMAEPDTIRLDVNIEANSLLKQRTIKGIESIQIGSKLKSIKLSDINVETVIEDEHKSKVCCLTEEEMLKLGSIALNVHKFYGNARDIEWGIKDKQIYLLQSRPITNLDNTFNEWEIMHDIDTGQPSEREYFSRANFGEIFPGASSYICLSWLSQIWMVAGIRAFKSMFNMVSKDFSPFYNFGCGVVSNQLFMAIKNGNPPFSLDPNSKITKGMQMAFFGHEFQDEELFNDSKDRKPKRPVSTSSKLSSAKIFMGIMFLAKKKLLKRRNSILAFDLLKDRNFNTSKELLDHILSNSEFMYLAIQTHSIASIYSMMNNMILMNLLSGNGKSNQNKDILFDFALLLSSSNDVVSAEVPNALRDIAVSIEYPEEFCSKSVDEALDYLKNGNNECNKRFKEFLTKHGHRGYKEFDVLVQQWAENPIPVVKSLQSMLMNGSSNLNPKEDKSLNEIISLIRTPISRTKKFLLKNFILPRCRDGVGLREQGKYLWIWTVNVYRHAFWRLSQMMVKEGRLPENDLLFYLYIHELEKLVNERDPVLVLRAKSRKRFHDKKDKLLFSETVIGPIMRPRNDITVNNLENTEGLPKIKGTPVCFGKVKARACVAVNIDGAKDIQSGDILITYSTDIGWSPYFPMLSGLATEIGGLISHGAVIAREYGLPCLIGVEGASNLFKTGDIVLLDSESGEIIKLESD